MSIQSVVTDPDSFFEQRVNGLSLVQATGIVLLVAVLDIVSSYLLVRHTMGGLPAETQQQIGTFVYASTIVGVLVATIVLWVVFAAVFHFLSTLVYDGEGSYRDTLVVTGWGHLPQLLAALISVGIIYYVLFVRGITAPQMSSMEEFQQYMQSIQSHPAMQVSSVVGIAGILWSGFVWISGVSRVQNIDEGDAFVVVSIPVALLVLWTLYSLL